MPPSNLPWLLVPRHRPARQRPVWLSRPHHPAVQSDPYSRRLPIRPKAAIISKKPLGLASEARIRACHVNRSVSDLSVALASQAESLPAVRVRRFRGNVNSRLSTRSGGRLTDPTRTVKQLRTYRRHEPEVDECTSVSTNHASWNFAISGFDQGLTPGPCSETVTPSGQ